MMRRTFSLTFSCRWLLLICHAMHVMTGSFAAWTPKGIKCLEGRYKTGRIAESKQDQLLCLFAFNLFFTFLSSLPSALCPSSSVPLAQHLSNIASLSTFTFLMRPPLCPSVRPSVRPSVHPLPTRKKRRKPRF